MSSTSWESSHKWYDCLVGEKGHYYHEHIVLPQSLKLLALKTGDSLLDLGCGQGVLSRQLPAGVDYAGIDASPSLIQEAKKRSQKPFHVGDITQPLNLKHPPFSHAALILVLQNLEGPEKALENAFRSLKPGGKLLLVLNHPCFRIPRQSSWGVDEAKKLQYRRLDLYMSPLKIPIQTNPSAGEKSPTTWSFHSPLSVYTEALAKSGFLIEKMEEWVSDKKSTGPKARMENRSREEFPLFLAILAVKRQEG
ncbi:MAG TPA: class I SAM-dependent methyltransferase [Rhabdochlamydiaceae bacterium]|nr:class I SAM-dependent methyltransferase [Rhabdochlamydiaceae bacterium]